MKHISKRLDAVDWSQVRGDLNRAGYALIKGVLEQGEAKKFIDDYDSIAMYRKTVSLERYRFGAGEYKYFCYPLPAVIAALREQVYPHLARLANEWMSELSIAKVFPLELEAMLSDCHRAGQSKPTVLILKYGEGGFNTLHQDLYGEIYFPFQLVLFLNEPGLDFSGGEFVLTEQVPRAQSKALVLNPGLGDMLILTTNFRPVKGSRGYYRAGMKHGVSPVHTGQRHTLGIIFHDALS